MTLVSSEEASVSSTFLRKMDSLNGIGKCKGRAYIYLAQPLEGGIEMKVLVLGAGNVGRAVAWDLRDGFDVHVGGDVSGGERLRAVSEFATPMKVDASNFDSLVEAMGGKFELVIGALPGGGLGYRAVRAAIRAGVDMVDVSFMPENPPLPSGTRPKKRK